MLPSGPRRFTGRRVVSLAQNLPGPVVCARLAADGAAVVKIEPPAGDPFAALSPSWYRELHEGIEVRALDLKAPDDRLAFSDLLRTADLLVTSQRPSALERLGLGLTTCAARWPHVRVLRIVGDRARPDVAGHDVTYQAEAGLLRDALPLTALADLMGASEAYIAATVLLSEPGGGHAEVGLRDSLALLTAPLRHGLSGPGAILGGGLPAYGVYRARTGHVAVAALEPHFRHRLYEALGLPLDAPLAEAFLGKDAPTWERWALERDIPLTALRVVAGPSTGAPRT